MAEFTPLDGVEGGAAFDGLDERLHLAEEGGGLFALGAGDGTIQHTEPEGFESREFVRFGGNEMVGELGRAFAEKVIAEQEERLCGHHGLVALTGRASRIHEVKEGSQAVWTSGAASEHRKINSALKLLRWARFRMLVVGRIDTFQSQCTAVLGILQHQRGTAAVASELAADGEHGVAHGLGIETLAVHAPEEFVFGIKLHR